MYITAFLLAVVTGGFLIEASMFPASIMAVGNALPDEKDLYAQDLLKKSDVEYMYEVCISLGSLSIFFSLVFLWNAVELGIILCCGRRLENSCLCEKFVKEEMRAILNEKV